ncbi:MAG: hypothetical protein V1685_02620 [Parcubacteria group bacterium]
MTDREILRLHLASLPTERERLIEIFNLFGLDWDELPTGFRARGHRFVFDKAGELAGIIEKGKPTVRVE